MISRRLFLLLRVSCLLSCQLLPAPHPYAVIRDMDNGCYGGFAAADYRFLTTAYSNDQIDIQEEGLCVKSTNPDSPNGIVYMDRELAVNRRLVLQVDQVSHRSDGAADSLVLGVTTCDRFDVRKWAVHRKNVCQPDGPCGGDSLTFVVRTASRPGDRITMTLVANGQICIKQNCNNRLTCFAMKGTAKFAGHTLYPFLMLTGNVSGIRIVHGTESESQSLTSLRPFTPVTPIDMIARPESLPLKQTAAVRSPSPASSSSSSIGNGNKKSTSYTFLIPEGNASKETVKLKNRTAIHKNLRGVWANIIHISPALEVGQKLIFRAEAFDETSPFSLTFGVTTLDRSVEKQSLSRRNCKWPNITYQIPHFTKSGIIYFERLPDEFIRFTIGISSYRLSDPSGMFTGKKAFPFIKLTGSICNIRIEDEAWIPKLPTVICVADFKEQKPLSYGKRKRDVPDAKKEANESKPALNLTAADEIVLTDSDSEKDLDKAPATSDSLAQSAATAEATIPTPNTHVIPDYENPGSRTWYSNQFVTQDSNIVSRMPPGYSTSYIFSSSMTIEEEITFKVLEIDTSTNGSMSFGVTSTPPPEIDLSKLPTDVRKLTNDNWQISENIIPVFSFHDEVSIKRTDKAILLTVGSANPVTLIQLDNLTPVFPFFCFNGCIKSVQLIPAAAPHIPPRTIGGFLSQHKVAAAVAIFACALFVMFRRSRSYK